MKDRFTLISKCESSPEHQIKWIFIKMFEKCKKQERKKILILPDSELWELSARLGLTK